MSAPKKNASYRLAAMRPDESYADIVWNTAALYVCVFLSKIASKSYKRQNTKK